MYFSFRDNHLYYAWDQICLVTDIIRSSYLFFFYVLQRGPIVYPRLDLNSLSSCISLSSAGSPG